MKPVKLFYQERCPFCKKALRYIEELKAEYPEFQPIEIEMIEETQDRKSTRLNSSHRT